jgi:hypothetical protein
LVLIAAYLMRALTSYAPSAVSALLYAPYLYPPHPITRRKPHLE